MSLTRYYSWLHDVDTWLADATLKGLEGVEIAPLPDTSPAGGERA